MSFLKFFASRNTAPRRPQVHKQRTRSLLSASRRRMLVENLEERALMAGSDNFISASAITGNVTTFSDSVDNSTFSMEAGELSLALATGDGGIQATKSAWWKFQVQSAGTVTIDTQGTNYPSSGGAGVFGAYGDTVIGAFTGNSVDALTTIVANDDADNICCFSAPGYSGYSKISFAATPGTTYYVEINGYDTVNSGDFGLTQFHYSGPLTVDLSPTTVYVDDSFSGVPGGTIADADLGTTGNQPAAFNVNAFTTINAALAAVAANGTIIVNGGAYAESVSLNNTRTLKVGGTDAAQAATINALASIAGTTINIAGTSSLSVGDATSTTIGGGIVGGGSLNKTGTGVLTLTGTNTYSGATNVLSGTLKAGVPVSTTNLVAYYDFNDPTNLGRDASGSANNGTLVGGAIATAGAAVGAGALALPDSAGGYLQMPNLASLFAGQAATLTMWVKLNVGTPTNAALTGMVNLGSGSNDHYPWVDGTTYQNVFRNNSRVDSIALSAAIDRTQWHLVTIVSDPTDAANGWRMYQNGTLIKTTSPVFGISGFQIGVQNGYFLNGAVDDVRLYNRALSTAEVQSVYNVNTIPDNSPVTVSPGATLEIGNSETIGSLSGMGAVTLGSNTLITGGNNTSTNYGGAIAGAGGVTKVGSGTFTLSGVNTYTGATNVNAGSLNLGGTGAAPALPGLYEWYDAADASTITQSGGFISQWRDKSGAGRNLDQATAAAQPTVAAGAMNGNPVVRFDGNDVISNVAAGNTPGTPYTVLSVARMEGTQNFRLITSNNNWLLGYWGNGMDQFYADGSVRLAGSNPVPDNAVHFYGAQGTGTQSTFFDGSRFIAQNNGGLTSPNGISLGAFAGNPASEASKGDVAELLVFTGILTPAQLADVYAYLQSKWLATSTILSDNSPVTVAAGANLNVNTNEIVGNLAGAGTTTLNKTLTVNESGNTTYAGALQGTSGLTKGGPGTLTLSGSSSHSGVINVSSGILAVTNSAALGSSAGATNIASGATLALSGGVAIASEPITAAGTGFGGLGAIRNLSGNNSLGGPINMVAASASAVASAVTMQSATASASFSQGGFSPADLIDGLVALDGKGWANAGNGGGSNAVFETTTNLNPTGTPTELSFSILNGGYGSHILGRFKIYVTSDDRANFANGAINNGQIGYNWTELQPTSVTSVNGTTLTVLGDNSVLASGTLVNSDTFNIKAITSLANITGIRLETIKDASLPAAGPGRAGNGNYVVVELNVGSAAADTANLTIGSDTGDLTLNGTINNPIASGTVTFIGQGNVALGASGGVTQASGTTNVVKNSFGTLTNSGANNNFAGALSINVGTYIAASNSAFGSTAGSTTVANGAVVAFTNSISVGNETLNVQAVNGNTQDAIVNLSGTNTFAGPINVVPYTFPIGNTTGVITGGDLGDGLDLTGTFVYAVNTGGPAAGPVQSVNFTSSEGAGTPGLTFSSPNQITNYTAPNYGNTANDNNLEVVMSSIRWNTGPVSFDMSGLIVGHSYKLQLLFSDAYNPANRRFNIATEGVTVATNFTSGATVANPVFTQIYQANDTVLNVLLTPGSFGDTNPIISGITVEDLGVPVAHDINIRTDAGVLNLNGAIGLNAPVLTAKGPGTLVIAGAIGETGTSSVVKNDGGILYVDGANSYSGLTTINNGYLVARNNLALGTTAAGTVVNSGGTLQLEQLINPVVILGESLSLSGSGVGGTRGAIGNWTGLNTFSGPITLLANSTMYSNTGNLELSGVIQGAAGFTNTKVGPGSISYTGTASNTFAGTTIMDLGTLTLGKTGGAVAISGPIQMGAGNNNQPNLRMAATNQFAPGIVMSGVAAQTLHARFDLQGFDQTLAGLVSPNSFLVVQNERLGGGGTTQAATLTLNGTGTYDFNGGFLRDEDDGGHAFKLNVIKTGTGTQTFSGANINYQGTTTVNQGTLLLTNVSAFASSTTVNAGGTLKTQGTTTVQTLTPTALTLNGGVYEHNSSQWIVWTGLLTVGANSTINVINNGASNQVFFDGGITGTNRTLTINNTGTATTGVHFRSNNSGINSYSGALIVNGGEIAIGNAAATWFANTDVTLNNSQLQLGVAAFAMAASGASLKSLNGNGTVTSAGSSTTLTLGTNNGSGTFNGTIINGAGGALAFIKTGTGTQVLTSANSFTGTTQVTGGGVLEVSDLGAIGQGTGSSWFAVQGATFRYTGTGTQTTTARDIYWNSGTATFDITSPTGNAVFNTTDAGGPPFRNQTLNKIGPGRMTLASSTASNMPTSGAINLNAGTFEFQPNTPTTILSITGPVNGAAGTTFFVTGTGTVRNDALTANWSANLASLNVATGATFDLRGNKVTVDALNGSGSIINSYYRVDSGLQGETLTVGANGGSGVYNGVISGSSLIDTGPNGRISLTKIGSGTQLLNGLNTSTGTTLVSAGTLGGDGAVGGPLTVNSGATLAPGTTIGDLASGSVTLQSGSIYAVTLNGTTPGTGYDQLVVTGTVTINGATLNVNALTPAVAGDKFRIISNDGTDPTVGTFAGLPEGATVTIGGQKFFITYNDPLNRFGTGNDVALVRNNPVDAKDDTFGPILMNTTFTGSVKTNDIDPDKDGVVTLQTDASHGTVIITNAATGEFTYTPDADYVGPDSFTYKLSDGESSDIATVSLTVDRFKVEGGVLYVAGTTASDRIILEAGIKVRYNNKLYGPFAVLENIVVYGNGGDDTITVSTSVAAPVELYGGEGADYLTGGSNNDTLDGGEGNDRLLGGNGNDVFFGGNGADTVSGGNGNDTIYGDDSFDPDGTPLPVDLPGKDTLNGDAGNDTIYGQGGNDSIFGGVGNDFLRGGDDSDTVDGGDGNDTLVGDAGGDKLYGRAGVDVLLGSDGFDTLLGGASADLLYADSLSDDSDDSVRQIAAYWFATTNQAVNRQAAIDLIISLGDDDNVGDSLNGEADADWYVTFASDSFLLASEKNAPNKVFLQP